MSQPEFVVSIPQASLGDNLFEKARRSHVINNALSSSDDVTAPSDRAPSEPPGLTQSGAKAGASVDKASQIDLFAASEGPEKQVGVVTDIREYSEWAVATLWTSERESIKITGSVVSALQEGLEYRLSGRSTSHPRHGDSFDVSTAAPHISDDDAAIVRYLRKAFDGIGEAKARKYVEETREKSGEEGIAALREKLLNSPWSVDLSSVSKKAKFNEDQGKSAQVAQFLVLRALQLRIGAVPGFREATWKDLASVLSRKILDELNAERSLENAVDASGDEAAPPPLPTDFVQRAIAHLLTNPYRLIGKVAFYNFPQAEQIGKRAGFPLDAPQRMAALVEHAVDAFCQSKGHAYLSKREFAEAVRKADPSLSAQAALVEAVKGNYVVIEGDRLYSQSMHAAEKKAANLIVQMMAHSSPISKRSAEDIRAKLIKDAAKIDPNFANGFAPEQLDAVVSVMTSPTRLHVLTGGPGTGKTTIVQALVYLCRGRQFAFGAPTGKAAKVLSSRVTQFGLEASTFHSLLRGDGSKFEACENEPLDADIIVADETTMDGVELAAAIMAAAKSDAHIIWLGDPGVESNVASERIAGQLPSISPGRFMQDLLKIPGINHVDLAQTFRNAGGILEVVNEVARGKLDPRDRDGVFFSHGLQDPEEGFPTVMNDYLARVAQNGLDKTLLIMPKRVGSVDTPGWNATFANHILREKLNSGSEKIPGSIYRLGDRVIIRENMRAEQPDASSLGEVKGRLNRQAFSKLIDWDALKAKAVVDEDEDYGKSKIRLVNGETGTIVAYSVHAPGSRRTGVKWMRLALDDGREVEYPADCISSLDLAYALTVHSAQGSEYPSVLTVITDGSPEFMNAPMLKTAFSRAKQDLRIYGDDRVLVRVAATAAPKRNSTLVERVAQLREGRDEEADSAEERESCMAPSA